MCTEPEQIALKLVLQAMKGWSRRLQDLSLVSLASTEERNSSKIYRKSSCIKNIKGIIPNGLMNTPMNAGAAILHGNTNADDLTWTQVMLGNEYHQYLSQIEEVKSILEFEGVSFKVLTPCLLKIMTEMKIFPCKSGNYSSSFLYEMVLPKLSSRATFIDKENDPYFDSYTEYVQSQCWYVVKHVFSYLLHAHLGEASQDLFNRILFSLTFHW
jgi:hypothetical protein